MQPESDETPQQKAREAMETAMVFGVPYKKDDFGYEYIPSYPKHGPRKPGRKGFHSKTNPNARQKHRYEMGREARMAARAARKASKAAENAKSTEGDTTSVS